jgi:biopolymer transport protein TolQ
MIGNSLWQLVVNSDAMSIAILLLLFALSIIAWSVFIIQFCIVRERNRQLAELSDYLETNEVTFDPLLDYTKQLLNDSANHVGAEFLGHQIHALYRVCNGIDEKKVQFFKNKEQAIAVVDTVLYDSIDRFVAEQSKTFSLFATIAGISPLLGLLGTVWGLIHAFLQISQTQVADLATVAPGISEALITTLVGLIVAIPALVFFNIMNNYNSTFEMILEKIGMQYRVLVLTQLVKDDHEKI